MAYSMNWRPQLDEIAASSPESASPQPGTAPTSTSTVKPDPKPSSNGVYADNMNWRPPSPSSKAEEAETGAESVPYSESYPSEDNKASTFRACRATDCPVVRCIGESAYSCSIDGLVATLEAEGDDDWCLDLHPIRVHLTPAQILTLARVIYSCIYAAVCQNQALDLLSIPTKAGKFTVTPGILLERFAFADQRFYHPPRPLLYKAASGRYRPRSDSYSRYSSSGNDAISVYIFSSPTDKNTPGRVQIGAWSLDWHIVDRGMQKNHPRTLSIDLGEIASSGSDNFVPALSSLVHYLLLDDARLDGVRFYTASIDLCNALEEIGARPVGANSAASSSEAGRGRFNGERIVEVSAGDFFSADHWL